MTAAINPENEKLYNARAAIPDNEEIIKRWQAASAEARATCKNTPNVRYGASPRQILDIYPAEKPNAPIMMFIHGGYWQARAPEDFNFIAPELVKLGFCTVLAGYDLCPTVTLAEITRQMQAAASYIWHHAAQYGGNRNRFYVSGHSAGGHLTAELMATDWSTINIDIPNDFVKGGCPISGVFDLTPLVETTINEKVGLDPDTAKTNSPLFREPISTGPLILAVGADESQGFYDQSDALEAKWAPKLARTKRINLEGCHHMAAVDELAKPGSLLLREIAKFIA